VVGRAATPPAVARPLVVRPPAPYVVPTPTHPDLVAAVVARLREWSGGAIATALGEATGVKKIWSDEVMGSPQLPWVRVTEIGEPTAVEAPESDGQSHYYGNGGQLQVSVFAAEKVQARDLRRSIIAALNDAPLVFDDGVLLGFWLHNGSYPPVKDPGVGVPTTYHAFATFTYFVDRTF